MHKFWAIVDSFWNQSRPLAWALCLTAFTIGVGAAFVPQSPGVAIGMLALAAGIMSVRPRMHPAEKFSWVSILIFFALLEVRSIRRSDAESAAIRNQQNEEFSRIVSGLKTATQQSAGQYRDTLTHVNSVLTQTQDVERLARKNLENVTGGSSFAFVYPVLQENSDETSLSIHNEGAQILSSITVTIYLRVRGSLEPSASGDLMMRREGTVNVGTIAPHEGRTIPPPEGIINLQQTGTTLPSYRVYVNAQNVGVSENLYFRRDPNGRGWEYKFVAIREVTGKRRASDIQEQGHWYREVKKVDWIQFSNQPCFACSTK